MKRGFTLIELLAVIVILAIIALIATPIVLNIIDETKDNASLRSAEFYLDALENSIAIATLNNRRITDGVYNILNTGNICIEEVENECKEELVIEVKGEKPNKGEITIKDGKIEDISLNLNNKVIVKDNNNKLVAIKLTPVGCFKYSDNDDGTITITGYTCGGETGTHKDVVIPRKIDGKSVTIIGDRAFQGNELTSVEIPDGVTSIGASAFGNNKLRTIEIPDGVTTIGDAAFVTNELTSVTIGSRVTTIGNSAFYNNQLTSIIIPDGVTTIGYDVFANNILTSLIIGNSVTTIGKSAFSLNRLKSIAIPNSVTAIGNGAFAYNQLTSVVIKGKSSTTDFTSYGSDVFGWKNGYSDVNITWQP